MNMMKLKAAEWFGILGVISLAYCAWNASHDPPDPSPDKCETELKAKSKTALEKDSVRASIEAGNLQIVGIHPDETEVNDHLCVSVAGVVSKAVEAVETEADVKVETLRAKLEKARDDYKAAIDEPGRETAEQRLWKALSDLKAAVKASSQPPALVELRRVYPD